MDYLLREYEEESEISMSWRLNSPKTLVAAYPLNGHARDVSGYGNHGTWGAGAVYAAFLKNSLSAGSFNGATASILCGNVGTVRTLAFWAMPSTPTEELIMLDAGKDIMVSAGVVTYAGIAATATYVDGLLTTALADMSWQHVACVLTADCAAADLRLGTDGVDFGAGRIAGVRTYNVALTWDEVLTLMRAPLPVY